MLLLFLVIAAAQRTRDGAIACSLKWVDMDCDGAASHFEVAMARERALKTLPVYLHGVARFFSSAPLVGVESVDDVMRSCDPGNDGLITEEDYKTTAATCLNTQTKINQVYDWLCIPGEQGRFKKFRWCSNKKSKND